MHRRKRERSNNYKPLALILSVVLLLTVVIGGVIAFLTDNTSPVVNTFEPQTVPVEVTEEFSNNVKTNVGVKNSAKIAVYVRVALTPTWEENGAPVGQVASLSDLNITWGSSDWVLAADGYYYYTKPVAAGETTPNLIDEAVVNPQTHNYDLNLNVMTQSIQAAGVGSDNVAPVVSSWKTGVSAVSATDGTGTLTIITG